MSSKHITATLAEIHRDWCVDDLQEAHRVLNLIEKAERQAYEHSMKGLK